MTLEKLLVELAEKYQVETVLERILGIASSVCDPLAIRGKRVVVARDDGPLETAKLDLVVVHGDERPLASSEDDWRDWLALIAKRATKLLVVEAANPKRRTLLSRFLSQDEAPRHWGATAAMAPVLWDLGRVRDHVFLGVPEGAPRKKSEGAASRHVFVVDVAPRTPQARRKVRLEAV